MTATTGTDDAIGVHAEKRSQGLYFLPLTDIYQQIEQDILEDTGIIFHLSNCNTPIKHAIKIVISHFTYQMVTNCLDSDFRLFTDHCNKLFVVDSIPYFVGIQDQLTREHLHLLFMKYCGLVWIRLHQQYLLLPEITLIVRGVERDFIFFEVYYYVVPAQPPV